MMDVSECGFVDAQREPTSSADVRLRKWGRGLHAALVLLLIAQLLVSNLLVEMGIVVEESVAYSSVMIALDTLLLFAYVLGESRRDEIGCEAALIVSYFIRLVYIYYVTFCAEDLVSDMAAYQASAIEYSKTGIAMLNGNYSFAAVLMGSVYRVFGIQTLMLRYCHSTLIVVSGVILLRALRSLQVGEKACLLAVVLVQFAYPLFQNSTTIHREAWICFFITVSLAELISWYCGRGARHAICSLVLTLPAMALHSGTAGYAAGAAIMITLYSPKECIFRFTPRSILVAFALITVVSILYSSAFNVFLQKFNGRTFENIVDMTETEKGGSYYRVGGNVRSPLQALLYTPLRLVYFYGSPMPWDWRDILDAIAFIVTGLPCLFVLWIGLRESRLAAGNVYRNLIIALVTILLAFGVVFGWGVRTAGTAMRHRNKVIAVEAAVLAMSVSGSHKVERRRYELSKR